MTGQAQTAQARPTVRSLQARSMNWAPALRHIEAELRASGYSIQHEVSDAVEPGELLDALQTRDADDVVDANVTVFRVGQSGIAYVWLTRTKRMYRAVAAHPDPNEAASILALRVVEIVRLQGLGAPEETLSVTPPAEATSSKVAHDETAGDRRWRITAGGGIVLSSGLNRPLPEVLIEMERRLSDWAALGLFGASSLHGIRQEQQLSNLRVGQHRVGLRLSLIGGKRLWWQLGPSIALQLLTIRVIDPEPTVSEETMRAVAAPSLFGRIGVTSGRLSFFVGAELGMTLPGVRLLEDDRVVSTIGRPWSHFGGGLAWAL